MTTHRFSGEGACPKCGGHRLAIQHAGWTPEGDRRMARPWTTDDEIRSAFLSPRAWFQAAVGFGTVFIVIVAILTAGGMDLR